MSTFSLTSFTTNAQTRELVCRDGRKFLLRPERAALMLIDMQREFLEPGGYTARTAPSVIDRFSALVPRVHEVLDAARDIGMEVLMTREGYSPDLSDIPPARLQRSMAFGLSYGAPGPMGRLLIKGEFGHQIVEPLRPKTGEVVIDKPGFGAFQSTPLDQILRDRRIEDLVFAGVVADVTVFSTLREAVDRGFRCLVLEDCTESLVPAYRDSMMDMIESEGGIFGWVSNSRELLSSLRRKPPARERERNRNNA